jgi:lysophospholipase L1-like esterase
VWTTPAVIAVAVAKTLCSSLNARQTPSFTGYAILVKGVEQMPLSMTTFFCLERHSPILRIAIVAGCVGLFTGCDKLGRDTNPNAPTPPPPVGSAIVYTAIGASDANGVGSSVVCPLFGDCSNGMGYVPVTVRSLRSQGFTVNHLNLGVPTAVISRDFQTLGNQYNHLVAGNFIEQEMPFVQTTATVVTIFAGLNEVNVLTAALGGGAGGSDPNGFMDRQVLTFGTNYATLLAGIKARAGSPRLVALNVPNAAGLPYLARASQAQRQAAQRISVAMTRTVVNVLTSQNVVVVDLMCDARTYLASNYSSDGLHPNDAGYAFMAAEVVRAITLRSYPAPQSNCSAMTLVP